MFLWQITRKGPRPETGLGQTLFELVAGCRLDLACDVDQLSEPLQVQDPTDEIDDDDNQHCHSHSEQDKGVVIVINARFAQDNPKQRKDISADKHGHSVLGIAVLQDQAVNARRPL